MVHVVAIVERLVVILVVVVVWTCARDFVSVDARADVSAPTDQILARAVPFGVVVTVVRGPWTLHEGHLQRLALLWWGHCGKHRAHAVFWNYTHIWNLFHNNRNFSGLFDRARKHPSNVSTWKKNGGAHGNMTSDIDKLITIYVLWL